jgi:hypothetical protein
LKEAFSFVSSILIRLGSKSCSMFFSSIFVSSCQPMTFFIASICRV